MTKTMREEREEFDELSEKFVLEDGHELRVIIGVEKVYNWHLQSQLDLLEEIEKDARDDMTGLYDYDQIAENVFSKILSIKKELK